LKGTDGKLNAVAAAAVATTQDLSAPACRIEDPTCEACQ